MNDTETSAKRMVNGGELYLQRHPGMRWEINFYELTSFSGNGMFLHSAQLADHVIHAQTFATPDDAAEAVRQIVAA